MHTCTKCCDIYVTLKCKSKCIGLHFHRHNTQCFPHSRGVRHNIQCLAHSRGVRHNIQCLAHSRGVRHNIQCLAHSRGVRHFSLSCHSILPVVSPVYKEVTYSCFENSQWPLFYVLSRTIFKNFLPILWKFNKDNLLSKNTFFTKWRTIFKRKRKKKTNKQTNKKPKNPICAKRHHLKDNIFKFDLPNSYNKHIINVWCKMMLMGFGDTHF